MEETKFCMRGDVANKYNRFLELFITEERNLNLVEAVR
jgi:hypothetical protein